MYFAGIKTPITLKAYFNLREATFTAYYKFPFFCAGRLRRLKEQPKFLAP